MTEPTDDRNPCVCGSVGDPRECVCVIYDCEACEGLGTTDDCCCERGQHDPRWCPQRACPACAVPLPSSVLVIEDGLGQVAEREAAFDWHQEYADSIISGDIPEWGRVPADSTLGAIKQAYVNNALVRLRAAVWEQEGR